MEVGDWVIGMLEWSEYVLLDYKTIQKLPVVFLHTFRIFKSKAISF